MLKLDEKVEKLGRKLRNYLFTKLKNSLDSIHAKIGTIRQFLPRMVEAMIGKKHTEAIELDYVENLPKNLSKTIEFGA